jgi:ribosomal protection tetracycline resistance protein
MGYDSERDVENPTGSIFCSQGTGFYVPWDQVKDHMHVESHLRHRVDQKGPAQTGEPAPWEELDEDDYRYLNTTANQGKRVGWNRRKLPSDPSPTPERQPAPIGEPRDCFLLVDGYNVIQEVRHGFRQDKLHYTSNRWKSKGAYPWQRKLSHLN